MAQNSSVDIKGVRGAAELGMQSLGSFFDELIVYSAKKQSATKIVAASPKPKKSPKKVA